MCFYHPIFPKSGVYLPQDQPQDHILFPHRQQKCSSSSCSPRFHLNIGDQTGWCAIHFCCSLAALLTLQILGGFQERKPNCFATWQRAACQPSLQKNILVSEGRRCVKISGAWNWIYFCLQRPCCYKFLRMLPSLVFAWQKHNRSPKLFDVKVIKFFTFASGSKPQSTMSACLAIVFLNNLFGMGPDCQPQNGWV